MSGHWPAGSVDPPPPFKHHKLLSRLLLSLHNLTEKPHAEEKYAFNAERNIILRDDVTGLTVFAFRNLLHIVSGNYYLTQLSQFLVNQITSWAPESAERALLELILSQWWCHQTFASAQLEEIKHCISNEKDLWERNVILTHICVLFGSHLFV